ncbi:MAG: PAS domain-containing protein [Deltaproteobacteria bacterium]|nr:PAS domain-containing protein [Deltaproteobacteria bacterium]NCP03781.1 PAS domain-containing protein [Deltaproteobacteria bacterium]
MSLSNSRQEIEALNRELNAIINSSSDGLFVCRADGTVIRVNPASERLHDICAADVLGQNIFTLVDEGFVDRSAALEAIRNRRQMSVLQNHRGRKLMSTGTPVFDEQGELELVVVTVRDVTELDQLQRNLEEEATRSSQFREQMLAMQQLKLEERQIIARSPAMVQVLQQAVRVGGSDSTVLILGESGVGKGVIADLIHSHSKRAGGPMIRINCGAIPETLIESELFGYEKGAFTGAQSAKPGYFELADGGTLFLDEVAELPMVSQVKLLRFLEDGRICRLGCTTNIKVNVRVLAATHRNLEQMVTDEHFRLDLFYRLHVIPLVVPPLRERRDCLLPLLRHYIHLFAQKIQVERRLGNTALDALLAYDYPGNVRELMNLCERLVVMTETEVIGKSDLPAALRRQGGKMPDAPADWQPGQKLNDVLNQTERQLLTKLRERFTSQAQIAAHLGVNQSTVARKLKKYALN